MSATEIVQCLAAVLSSTLSQLCIKASSAAAHRGLALGWLGCAVALLFGSVVLAVLVLRSLPLSRLMPFAALAYVLVPLGAHVVFGERLTTRFWWGALCIVVGVAWMHA